MKLMTTVGFSSLLYPFPKSSLFSVSVVTASMMNWSCAMACFQFLGGCDGPLSRVLSSTLLCLLHELAVQLWRWVEARQNSWTPSSWRENDQIFLYYFHPESVLLLTLYFLPLILFIFAFIFSPTGRLEEYLNCMDKIQKAVEYFQDNNPDSPELNRVVGHRSGSLHGRDRDSHSPATRPLAVRGWWACCLVKKGFGHSWKNDCFGFCLSLNPAAFLLVIFCSFPALCH